MGMMKCADRGVPHSNRSCTYRSRRAPGVMNTSNLLAVVLLALVAGGCAGWANSLNSDPAQEEERQKFETENRIAAANRARADERDAEEGLRVETPLFATQEERRIYQEERQRYQQERQEANRQQTAEAQRQAAAREAAAAAEEQRRRDAVAVMLVGQPEKAEGGEVVTKLPASPEVAAAFAQKVAAERQATNLAAEQAAQEAAAAQAAHAKAARLEHLSLAHLRRDCRGGDPDACYFIVAHCNKWRTCTAVVQLDAADGWCSAATHDRESACNTYNTIMNELPEGKLDFNDKGLVVRPLTDQEKAQEAVKKVLQGSTITIH